MPLNAASQMNKKSDETTKKDLRNRSEKKETSLPNGPQTKVCATMTPP